MQHEEKAFALFLSGYNCAQSVFAAFVDATGLEESISLKLSASFGGGMGKLREVCGAVSGMLLVLGSLYGYDSLAPGLREQHYARVRALAKKFKENHQCLICRQLLAQQKAAGILPDVPRETDPCGQYIRSAARLLDEYIRKNPQEFTG